MNTVELPQYAHVVAALAPILNGLPGKIIALDGRTGSGKTTLGRYLAWRFNVTLLEADLFLQEARGHLEYRIDEIERVIQARLSRPRPIIVDSVAVLRLLETINRKPDFMIYVRNTQGGDGGNLKNELDGYDAEFLPRLKSNLDVEVSI